MVWQAGKSGNPGGRKKLDPVAKEMFSPLLPEALKAVKIGLASDDEDLRLRAASMVLDRVFGKPAQGVELTGADQGPLKTVLEIVFGNPDTSKPTS